MIATPTGAQGDANLPPGKRCLCSQWLHPGQAGAGLCGPGDPSMAGHGSSTSRLARCRLTVQPEAFNQG